MSAELSQLRAPEGANRKPKIKGRGMGSGHGKTSTRGMKGQKARKSGNVRSGFEGNNMPLTRKMPKRGFANKFASTWLEIQVSELDRCDSGQTVNWEALKSIGVAKRPADGIKIIGNAKISKKLKVIANRMTEGARRSIEAAGGTVELIADRPKWERPDTRAKRRASKKA